MLPVLLFQAASLLPLVPDAGADPDPVYLERLEALVADGSIPVPPPEDLRPAGAARVAVLREFLLKGSDSRVRLAAVLGSGAEAGSVLARSLVHAACSVREEGAALAALLAPAGVSLEELPALARLALAEDRSLAVRAAATGRLLEAGCGAAWPVARSILRSGTAYDEDAPWADWPRTGRYELPKRVLLLFVDGWLDRNGLPPSGFEPNAAWADQVDQLKALEPLAARARAADPGLKAVDGGQAMEPGLRALLLRGEEGDERALRALALLQPYSTVFLVEGSTRADGMTAAQRALELAPL